jgi:hypothetical protein
MTGDEIIRRSAALRGKGKYREAIELIEASISNIEEYIRLNVQFEALRVAVEAGDAEMAHGYAATIAAAEPVRPSSADVALIDGELMWAAEKWSIPPTC